MSFSGQGFVVVQPSGMRAGLGRQGSGEQSGGGMLGGILGG